jgi:DNA invertase Pin-like site-specific DNA recombinase
MARVRAALYARVSTDSQTVDNQVRELREAGARLGWDIVGVYSDAGISGAKGRDKRPQLDAMLRDVTRGKVDLVAAWAVDRLGRSLADLVALLQELHAKQCGLYLHQQGLDTTTPAGKAMFQMMGVFAEFERSMISERVKSGLERARAAGAQLGRPSVGADVEARVLELRAKGRGMLSIAREVGCGTSVVQRLVKQGLNAPEGAAPLGDEFDSPRGFRE